MPLTIAVFAALGLGARAAAGLAALCSGGARPDRPVLAGDVQVGPPGSGEEDETRFALTSEAGLNDGLAFPFVHGAILLALFAAGGEASLGGWLSYQVAWKLAAGVAVGWAVGARAGLGAVPPAEPGQALAHGRRLRRARRHLPRLRR